MRIGLDLIGISDPGFDLRRAGDVAADAEAAGFASVWFANLTRGADALSLITLAGQATSTIELGTAVVPTYPRHPLAMAQQAATTNGLVGGRLGLGIRAAAAWRWGSGRRTACGSRMTTAPPRRSRPATCASTCRCSCRCCGRVPSS